VTSFSRECVLMALMCLLVMGISRINSWGCVSADGVCLVYEVSKQMVLTRDNS
jgi:hypothetical protein